MGEVYRAKDLKLNRDVALKVLHPAFSGDEDRLRRFKQEACAAGSLNHPNILTIYDVGNQGGIAYLVSELLEGKTLRDYLRSTSLRQPNAIDYALQVARGLEAAHKKGIVHRDLKPENIFIMKDGRLKILDFGLAKLIESTGEGRNISDMPTLTLMVNTDTGVIMGTEGYMSPEQVRGQQTVDYRSDIFTFGAILYEMLSGKPAFLGGTSRETREAILEKEPPELSEINPNIHPAVERMVKRCLEKKPERRFQSASDLAFALETLSGVSGPSTGAVPTKPERSRKRLALSAICLVLVAAVIVASIAIMRSRRALLPSPPAAASFHQLTFRSGAIQAARFASDGQTVVYSAAWDGKPLETFLTNAGSRESRSLGLPNNTCILAVSSSGEMALLLHRHFTRGYLHSGTLGSAPLTGLAAREIVDNVQEADWAPDGNRLAIVRNVGAGNRLEFPIGTVLYETSGWISHPRVSPKGDFVAFIHHPVPDDDSGAIMLVDCRTRQEKTLSGGWVSAQGLAWSATGDEVWFTADKAGNARALYAVTLSAQARQIQQDTGSLTLQDISRDGHVLLTRDKERLGIMGLPPNQARERDLSWLDWSLARDLSPDGKTLLFTEAGEGGGATYAVYLRNTDGSPAVRLGDGSAMALSPDGKWVLSTLPGSPPKLVLLPTGTGEPKVLENDTINYHVPWASWFPDGERILFLGNEPGHSGRLYVQDLRGGKPYTITPDLEGIRLSSSSAISPDGKLVVAINPDQNVYIYPVEGGEPRLVRGLDTGDEPIQWSRDGRSLFICQHAELPARIYRLDLLTGHKQLWKEITPADPAGIQEIIRVILTADGKWYAYTYERDLSDLYLVEGLNRSSAQDAGR